MDERIQDALSTIEREEGVRVLYACESGSRAWGFESADSDYDVRFLYLHPTPWYLCVRPGRDVIERPVDGGLDLSGWDLRKAVGLLSKSNPPLFEWLQSPIVYREVESATRRLRELIPEYYSPVASYHHYLHMAQGNLRDYLRGDVVWVKKYFLYALLSESVAPGKPAGGGRPPELSCWAMSSSSAPRRSAPVGARCRSEVDVPGRPSPTEACALVQ